MTEPTLRALSLGAGVQSTTLLLLAVEGALPKPDVAIFADTGWEPAAVYGQVDRLAQIAADAGIDFHRVSNGNLRHDLINPSDRYASIPYFVRNTDGSEGMGRRQCTSEYKLSPITRKVRELLGAEPPDYRRVKRGKVCEQWIGFSTDEIGRVSDRDQLLYIRKRYPLLELGMSRKDCQRWLKARGWGDTVKSACIGCPFHGNRAWRDLRDNRPDEWADAVEFDKAIRKGGARGLPLNGEAFLHRSRVPLDLAPIDRVTRREHAENQTDIFDAIEDGDPDGCSPYGCRSGPPAGRGGLMPTLHLVQQWYAHPAETIAQAYDLTLAGLDTERADGGDLECWHCDRVIAADDDLHTDEDARPECARCAMERDK